MEKISTIKFFMRFTTDVVSKVDSDIFLKYATDLGRCIMLNLHRYWESQFLDVNKLHYITLQSWLCGLKTVRGKCHLYTCLYFIRPGAIVGEHSNVVWNTVHWTVTKSGKDTPHKHDNYFFFKNQIKRIYRLSEENITQTRNGEVGLFFMIYTLKVS